MSSKSKLGTMVLKFNLFTKPVALLLQKEIGHRTLVGVFLTTCMVTILGIFVFSYSQSLVIRDNPIPLQTQVHHNQQDEFRLGSDSFMLSIKSKNAELNQLYSPSLQLVTVTKRSQSEKVTRTAIPLRQCNDETMMLHPYFYSLKSYCIDWSNAGNVNLSGSNDSDNQQYLELNLELCNIQTNSECLTEDVVRQLTISDQIDIRMTTSIVNILDPLTPNEILGKLYTTPVSNRITKYTEFVMQPFVTYSDDGYFAPEVYNTVTLSVSNYYEKMGYSDNLVYSGKIYLDSVTLENYRSYPKVQDALGNLGGLFEILYITCFIIITPFNNLTYSVKILNEIFNFDQEPQQPVVQSARISPLDTRPSKKEQLQQIFQKALRLEKMARQSQLQQHTSDAKSKSMLLSQIADSITEFFRSQEGKLTLGFFDYFRCCQCKDSSKSQLIKYSMGKITHNLDIIFIIKKLQEIDKLKVLLLNQDQIKLFDFLPKPKIASVDNLHELSEVHSILKPEKTDLEKALEAQKAYQELVKDSKNAINQKLFSCIDEDLLKLFEINLNKGVARNTQNAMASLTQIQNQIEEQNEQNEQESDSDSDSNSSNQPSPINI